MAAAATAEAPALSREKQELSQLMNKEYKCVLPAARCSAT